MKRECVLIGERKRSLYVDFGCVGKGWWLIHLLSFPCGFLNAQNIQSHISQHAGRWKYAIWYIADTHRHILTCLTCYNPESVSVVPHELQPNSSKQTFYSFSDYYKKIISCLGLYQQKQRGKTVWNPDNYQADNSSCFQMFSLLCSQLLNCSVAKVHSETKCTEWMEVQNRSFKIKLTKELPFRRKILLNSTINGCIGKKRP